jgi:hypothetical protein
MMNSKKLAPWMGIVFSLLLAPLADATESWEGDQRPIAYVYDGEGACPEDCAKSAAEMAYRAGLRPVYIGPQDLNFRSDPEYVKHFFDGVKVWVQPGGHSRSVYRVMSPVLRKALLNFVFSGGGYVGFCAGAFISTNLIGSSGLPGFSILPGKSAPLMPPPTRPGLAFSIEEVIWNGKSRAIYFEGGPYLYELPPEVEVVATFKNGKIAAARTHFGLGKVFVSGPHPEAPKWWYEIDHVNDRDGDDHDLAVEMIQWAAFSKK